MRRLSADRLRAPGEVRRHIRVMCTLHGRGISCIEGIVAVLR
jgi:hypothetical protein